MSAPAHHAPADLLRISAGTTAGAAVREAGPPGRGEPGAIVVVRQADGTLRDLSWAPDADADVVPVAAVVTYLCLHLPPSLQINDGNL